MRDPKVLNGASHRVLYGEPLDSEASKGHPPLSALHLCHEALSMFAEGSHPLGVTLMSGFYYLLRDPEAKQRLMDEVLTAWPVLDGQAPGYEDLEKLPYLASVVFICLIEFAPTTEQSDGGGQRVAAHRRADTRGSHARIATIWCNNIGLQNTRRGPCFVPTCHPFMPNNAGSRQL